MLMDALAMKIHHFQNISMLMHWGLFEMLSNYLAPKIEFVHLMFFGAS